jgi:hypothetical protein
VIRLGTSAAPVQMIDLHVPTTDGRELLLTRYTKPEPELAILFDKLNLVLPPQPEPKNQRRSDRTKIPGVVKTFEGPIEGYQPLTSLNPFLSAKIG